MPKVLLSRCDRLGDLILSLPALGYLRQHGIEDRILHCSSYAADIGQWALHNELCSDLWIDGQEPPESLVKESSDFVGIALFHSRASVRAFKKLGLKTTFAPRSKLSTLWSYKKTFVQKRSRCLMSEMEYNVDLVRCSLKKLALEAEEFIGLPALEIPPDWKIERKSPKLVIVVSNYNSAVNWGIDQYIKFARDNYEKYEASIDFLVSGFDAHLRKEAIENSGLLEKGVGLVEVFPQLRDLVVYLAGAGEVMSSSTGPLHIAHAAGTPVFALYPNIKTQSFDRWRPHGYWHSGAIRYQVIP